MSLTLDANRCASCKLTIISGVVGYYGQCYHLNCILRILLQNSKKKRDDDYHPHSDVRTK